MGVTIFADIDWSAIHTVVVTLGLIDGAGFISHVLFFHVFESADGISTMATLIVLSLHT
jgi:hypothetical protein